jgi:glutamyl-tRNA synthetase
MTVASGTKSIGRLAPSPTGALHLGNARTFLLAWLSIRSRGGTLLLRVEDIDGPRVKTETVVQALADLRWLGLDWDGEPVRQSERLPHYERAAAALVAAGLAYPCVCSRREVEEAASAPHAGDEGPAYPGTCRGKFADLAAAKAATGRDAALRFRVDVDAVPFDDGFCGPQRGAIQGDFVIQKRDGGPAYQLAVVVDDAAQAVNEVVRADDLLPSTPRQLLLYRALGLTPPRFVHLPLVIGADGRRLAKRHGDTSLHHLRALGVPAELVVGRLAYLSGLGPPGASCRPHDLLAMFAWSRVPRDPVRGDETGWYGG